MRKVGIRFMISPLMVGALWLLFSFVFWLISLFVSEPSMSFVVIKFSLNWIAGILGVISLFLLYLGIIFTCVGKSKISLGEMVTYGWNQSLKHMSKFLLGFGIYIVLQIVDIFFGYNDYTMFALIYPAISIVVTVLVVLACIWLGLGFKNLSLHIAYGKTSIFSDVFVNLRQTGMYILSSLLVAIFTVIGIIFFVLPGIYISLRLRFVGYLILHKDLGPWQAIEQSWNITKGFASDLFALNLLCRLINILGVFAIFVGLLRTLPLMMIANAYLYRIVSQMYTKKTIT